VRYAIVRNADSAEQLAAYLPENYAILHELVEGTNGHERLVFVIAGEDVAGWTLDDYVIPRLASGLLWCTEVDLPTKLLEAARAKEPM
jgi:hypothetical protein